MRFDSWTCLLNQKGPGIIPDNIKTGLKIAACYLHLHQLDQMLMPKDLCPGMITTDRSTYRVGACSGILFKAVVETDSGKHWINFLLNTRDLERGAEAIKEYERGEEIWDYFSESIPVEDFYRFEDLGAIPTRQ